MGVILLLYWTTINLCNETVGMFDFIAELDGNHGQDMHFSGWVAHVHVFTCMHEFTCVFQCVFACMSVHMHVRAHVHTCVHVYGHVLLNVCVWVCVCLFVCVHVCACVYVCLCVPVPVPSCVPVCVTICVTMLKVMNNFRTLIWICFDFDFSNKVDTEVAIQDALTDIMCSVPKASTY